MRNKSTDTVNDEYAGSLIKEYQYAVIEIQKAFRLLIKAKGRMRAAFGVYNDSILPNGLKDYNLDRDLISALKMLRSNAWKGLVEKTQLRKVISYHHAERLDRRLERGDLPELDQITFSNMVADLCGDLDHYFDGAVKELFQWFGAESIGKMVIVCSAVSHYDSISMDSHSEHRFSCLDNVFHILDGKGFARHDTDASVLIKEAIGEGEWSCETAYFHFRWFRNGNMHIKFKRLDLVRELNRISGGDSIKP